MPSFEKINYGLRPAKNVERKMLVEAFRKLSDFGKVDSYRYIGFGSTYFSDFVLFHKALGIRNMISIEKNIPNQERFRFNCPYKCVKLVFGHSNAILPTLQWDVRSILWLDYDGKLDSSVLTDIKFWCSNATSGCVLVVTVSARPEPLNEINSSQVRLERLREQVGADKVPSEIKSTDLEGWGLASTSRRIIANEIAETLSLRNGGRDEGAKMVYKQLFNFHYQDGSKMLTTGGLLFDQGQEDIVAKCGFDSLPFVTPDNAVYKIEVPNLTYREMRHLDSQLPVDDFGQLKVPGVSEDDVSGYGRVYRYFPNFAEAEL